MNDFVLIDLVSQRAAVRHYLSGKPKKDVLAWLSTRGRLTTRTAGGREVFDFESAAGLGAIFFFDEDGIIFVGDHFTFR